MDQRLEKARVEADAVEGLAFGQDRHGIVAVQAFLMAGDHAEIAHAHVRLELFGEKPRRVLDKDRVGGVQFGKGGGLKSLE